MATQEETMGLLKEIAEHADKVQWRQRPMDVDAYDTSAKAFVGVVDDWVLLVVSFDIEKQGFPKGARGYDGTGMRRPNVILRLTRDLAEKLFKLAEAAPPVVG